MAIIVVAYAFSPIDLISDFIPILGYVDDLILVPLGIVITIRLSPPHVLERVRRDAEAWQASHQQRPKNWFVGALILAIWNAGATVGWRYFTG